MKLPVTVDPRYHDAVIFDFLLSTLVFYLSGGQSDTATSVPDIR
jgi:hypothetical protein